MDSRPARVSLHRICLREDEKVVVATWDIATQDILIVDRVWQPGSVMGKVTWKVSWEGDELSYMKAIGLASLGYVA